MNTVEKFGGSSMAWPSNVVQRIEADDPRIVVVSAPGRDGRSKIDGEKMTDLLRDNRVDEALNRAEDVARRTELTTHEQTAAIDVLDQWMRKYSHDTWARAAGGELFSAHLIAYATDRQILDPLEAIYINPDRSPDINKSGRAIQELASDPDARYVLPGFYGRSTDGSPLPHTMERGGSDATGALAARALRLSYINLSDVSGVYTGDPEKHKDTAVTRDLITYRESRAFAFLGNEVLHPEVARILGATGLDTWMGSLHDSKPRTQVTQERIGDTAYNYVGVSSRNVWQVDFHSTGMDDRSGVASEIYKTFADHNTPYLLSDGGPDRTSVFMPNGDNNSPAAIIESLKAKGLGFEMSMRVVALAGVVLTGRQPYMQSTANFVTAIANIDPSAKVNGDLDGQVIEAIIDKNKRDEIEAALHDMIIENQ